MIRIDAYIKLTKQERQRHLQLDVPCIERGADSQQCRGLLAHILDTTTPTTKRINCCHACHNAKCNNPYHLYWGTSAENRQDAIHDIGKPKESVWQRTVNKYGIEVAKSMRRMQTGRRRAGHKAASKVAANA